MMPEMGPPPRPVFSSDEEYEASLRDSAFWEPYARAALREAGLPDEGDVVTHFPTTHVSAVVGSRYFVKLHYEDWFGEECFQTERAFYRASRGSRLPIPDLLAEGALYEGEGWRWPFLVLTAMPGRDLRSVGEGVDRGSMERVATFAGAVMRELHDLRMEETEPLKPSTYTELIRERTAKSQRDHLAWGSLPERLALQIRDYLWERRDLVDPERSPRKPIHGDLHRGNLFVDVSERGLEPTGIVDFNDLRVGDPHYDLVSLHIGMFRTDKALLRIALDAYGWALPEQDWVDRMMGFTLVHDYDMIQHVVSEYPGALEKARTLDEVADLLWNLDALGPAELE